MQNLMYPLRVVWACAFKEIQTALALRGSVVQNILRPVFVLVMLALFAVGGGIAPTAVVMNDTGPYAQQFYAAMASAHSFNLQVATAQEAQSLIDAGKIVAVVTIPADFDTQVEQQQPVQVPVEINNLNIDFTNDLRRAIPLSITLFYGQAFPALVSVTPREQDFYPQDTGYLPYLMVSALVLALMVLGLTNAGEPAAREWEEGTIKELLLSPASRLAIVTGKILGAFIMGIVSIAVLLIIILVTAVTPAHWGEAIGFTLLALLIFIAFGYLMGSLLKKRMLTTLVAFGAIFPIASVSGIFGPISFQPVFTQWLAMIFPPYYAIVLEQHAFYDFTLNTFGLGLNVAILSAYALLLMVLAALVLRRRTTVAT